ncbi:class I SAM-dependent methyltransferase [Massilia sp. LXY-6]|uniref:class I SAM-dependent methyltransferase n=1 Tax=Massilia sp. LXY-6 TaxID=3379823 RepID=UPI003EE19B5C
MSNEQMEAIRRVDHFARSEYRQLDLNQVLDEYMGDFVEPLLRLAGLPGEVADVGAGYGWLALAFALRTEAKITAIEYDGARLEAARQIAGILGVAHRIEWVQASIAGLPLPERSMDAVYCIEVIEHTGVRADFVAQLCRISRDVLVITTPNKLFPVINHDTALPFCHWLPLWVRDLYASAFGRGGRQDNNLFWSPRRLFGSAAGFRRVSRFMQFASYADYRELRLAGGRRLTPARRCMGAYFALASLLGRWSVYVLPNLASTFRRRG